MKELNFQQFSTLPLINTKTTKILCLQLLILWKTCFFRMLCNNESLKIPKNLQEMFNLKFQSFYSVPVPAT